MPDDIMAEYGRCHPLRQRNIDDLLRAGVPSMGLVRSPFGGYAVIGRDLVHMQGARFEFERYAPRDGAAWAYVWPAFDPEGQVVDLIAWRPPASPAAWRGACGMLGEENLYVPRLGEPLRVHPDPMAWLRADRQGVCIVDPVRAASLLRETGTLVVASLPERQRLRDMLAVSMPQIKVEAVA